MTSHTRNQRVRSKVPKADYPTILLHWALLAALIVSFVTGMQIAADDPASTWAKSLRWILPQGNVIVWHLISALLFAAIVVAYTAFLWSAGMLRRISLNKKWWRMLISAKDSKTRWRSINTLIYWLGFAALIFAFITGLLMDLFVSEAYYAASASIHQFAAWTLPIYILLHVTALVIMSGWAFLLKLFRPRIAYSSAALVALGAGGVAAAALFMLQSTVPAQFLNVAKTTGSPKMDGKASEAVWEEADEVVVLTTRGENLPDGAVEVSIKALHDDEHLYALIQWPDSTRSQKHLPLIKTETGWIVQQTEYGIQDEDAYYEDKFGVMLSDRGRVAGNHSIHMGAQPLEGKPGPAGNRGLHYTTDGSIVDVWHWKSVRTGNSVMGQIDDNYFGPPMKPKDKGRYTGGYNKDPKDGGGYEMNWDSYSDAGIVPKYLPADPDMLEVFQHLNMSPSMTDRVPVYLNKADVVPYKASLDTIEDYPVGTVMPSVIVDAAMTGDRGDVTAKSIWHNGTWTMEIKRKLDTGSQFDVAFRKDRPTYLWVSAFNHTQTRHSRHLYPVIVELE
ncbi:MAG: ethylbenzene dehydrogenase-related protein [Pseudomonadota bacterium]